MPSKNRQELPGTTIALKDTRVGTASDGFGFYQMKQIPAGKYLYFSPQDMLPSRIPLLYRSNA